MGLVALAVSAAVERNDPLVLFQIREDARLDPTCNTPRVPVDEDHWLARALVDVADANTVRIEELVLRSEEVECEEVECEDNRQNQGQSQEPGHSSSFVMHSRGHLHNDAVI